VQLITAIQVAPNSTDDQTLLAEAVPQLQKRMPLADLHVYGGYNGPEATRVAAEHAVTVYLTAIRGAQPDPDAVT